MKVYVLQKFVETFSGETYWQDVKVTANKQAADAWDSDLHENSYDVFELEDFNPIDNFTVTC